MHLDKRRRKDVEAKNQGKHRKATCIHVKKKRESWHADKKAVLATGTHELRVKNFQIGM